MCARSALLAFLRGLGFATTASVLRASNWLGLSALALAGYVGSGCADERTFPHPGQMCEDLVWVCGDPVVWEYPDLRRCYDIGRAGMQDSLHEDQCFAAYNECISDCSYFAYWLGSYDAGYTDEERTEPGSSDTLTSEPGSSDTLTSGSWATNTAASSSTALNDAGTADAATPADAAASTSAPLETSESSADASLE